jgi:hypothetical protein
MSEPALLLLARAGDPIVGALRRFEPQRLVHVDIPDLTSAGWRYEVGRPALATACARGRVLASSEIGGVLCRLTAVGPQDVSHLHGEDRAFAATEINAFLRAWLAQFGERLCNEPSPASLAGPAWHAMRWRWLARRLNVPVVTDLHDNVEHSNAVTVLVTGNEAIGTANATLVRHSLDIAAAVRCKLLSLRFVWDGRWRFESADSFPQPGMHGAARLLEWATGARSNPSQEPRVAASAVAG